MELISDSNFVTVPRYVTVPEGAKSAPAPVRFYQTPAAVRRGSRFGERTKSRPTSGPMQQQEPCRHNRRRWAPFRCLVQ